MIQIIFHTQSNLEKSIIEYCSIIEQYCSTFEQYEYSKRSGWMDKNCWFL